MVPTPSFSFLQFEQPPPNRNNTVPLSSNLSPGRPRSFKHHSICPKQPVLPRMSHLHYQQNSDTAWPASFRSICPTTRLMSFLASATAIPYTAPPTSTVHTSRRSQPYSNTFLDSSLPPVAPSPTSFPSCRSCPGLEDTISSGYMVT